MNLLIVESPHKAQTISQWLDRSKYIVIATAGHIKNLPKNDYGIDNSFEGQWNIMPEKREVLQKLKEAIKKSSRIFIGTDDDREGERIAFDLVDYFKLKDYYRVIFHEITKNAISNALKNALFVDDNKVNSQKARRLIDRIIGYPISSAIRKYFKENNVLSENEIKNIGTGRVSASALGIIVRQEKMIENFTPEKYSRIYINYMADGVNFSVTNGIKYKEDTKEEMYEMIDIIKDTNIAHTVHSIKRETKDTAPYPPLTTTRVLRSLNYLYGFEPKETMKILQKLYDGVKIGNKRIGLITYPRTDSINLSDEAVENIISFLNGNYESEYIVDVRRDFKKTNDLAQEAHEAIRPTTFTQEMQPANVKDSLDHNEHKVYEFIFYRTIATQMSNSVYDVSKIVIDINSNKFGVKANKRIFDGWEILLNDKIKQGENEDEIETMEVVIPNEIYMNDVLKPLDVNVLERDDKTPPRFGLGRFITTLESNAIGRPSTIADIPNNLKQRGLINVINNMIKPTNAGMKLYDFLEERATWLIDIEHTKEFEKNLDEIEKGEDYTPLLEEYDNLKNKFLADLGYDYMFNDKPEDWLIEKCQKIAKDRNIILTDEDLNSKKKLLKLYNEAKSDKSISKCFVCKKGDIIEYDKSFKCNKYGCNVSIIKSNITDFFKNFGKTIDESSAILFLQQIGKLKKVYIKDLYSKKKDKTFGAFIKFKKNGNFLNLELDFSSKIKTIDEKYYFDSFNLSAKEEKPQVSNGYIDVNQVDIHSQQLNQLTEEKRMLEDKAYKDPLTRSFNRQKFEEDVSKIMSNNLLDRVILGFVDGDKFKSVNDTYGHQAGDEILKLIVNNILEVIRPKSINLYRYGGEEFCIISLEDEATTLNTLEEIRIKQQQSIIDFQNQKIGITLSIGVDYGKNHNDFQSLLKGADDMVYQAKENGRNRIEINPLQQDKHNSSTNYNIDEDIEW